MSIARALCRSLMAGLAANPMGYAVPPTGACTECGNDDPAEGFTVCSDCLEEVGDGHEAPRP